MPYEFKTTFWNDFTIADAFGEDAVRDTFARAFDEWKSNTAYVTELVMVTNWKCWEHYENGNRAMSELYAELYHEADSWCLDNLRGADLEYFFKTTD